MKREQWNEKESYLELPRMWIKYLMSNAVLQQVITAAELTVIAE